MVSLQKNSWKPECPIRWLTLVKNICFRLLCWKPCFKNQYGKLYLEIKYPVPSYNSICFFLAMLGLCCHAGSSSSCAARASRCLGFSCWALDAQASVAGAHGLSCSEARGIFLDQGSNLCLLHQQVASLPLSHQGNPIHYVWLTKNFFSFSFPQR